VVFKKNKIGAEKAVKLLLSKGADPLSKDFEGSTALHKAAYGGLFYYYYYYYYYYYLISFIEFIDELFFVYLFYFFLFFFFIGFLSCMRLLLENVPDKKSYVNLADEFGCTALHHSAKKGHLDCVLYLLGMCVSFFLACVFVYLFLKTEKKMKRINE